MGLLKQVWHNLSQTPILDRIFYVPFWDCPYLCDFCCVDARPGKPPTYPDKGEPALFALGQKMYQETGKHLQVHVYGGEPLLRPEYLKEFISRLMNEKFFKKLFLYTTLRPPGIEEILALIPEDKIKIIVNPSTINDAARARMHKFSRVTETYKNIVFFPTGRARLGSTSYKKSLVERILPIGLPGKSCFASISGPLVNGIQETVHLCCLPQSPIVGSINENIEILWNNYLMLIESHYKEVNSRMKKDGLSFACSVCEIDSKWSSTKQLNDGIAISIK